MTTKLVGYCLTYRVYYGIGHAPQRSSSPASTTSQNSVLQVIRPPQVTLPPSMVHERHPIPQELLDAYMRREISSRKLAEATGYSAVYLRRTLKRPPREPQLSKYEQRKKLVAMRKLFLNSLRHLPIHEIVKQGHVSQSTAWRIKKGYHAPKTPTE